MSVTEPIIFVQGGRLRIISTICMCPVNFHGVLCILPQSSAVLFCDIQCHECFHPVNTHHLFVHFSPSFHLSPNSHTASVVCL